MNITPEMIERGAKALYESLPLSSVMPIWEDLDDTFKVDWWRRARVILEVALGTDEKLQELEAQCAVMRDALTEALELIDVDNNCPCWECERDRQIAQRIKEGFSSSAGRDLLERLKKLEAVAATVQAFVQVFWKTYGNRPGCAGCLVGEVRQIEKALAALEGGEQNGN